MPFAFARSPSSDTLVISFRSSSRSPPFAHGTYSPGGLSALGANTVPVAGGPSYGALRGGFSPRTYPLDMGLIYFGIRVTDLQRSERFYVEGLGLTKLRGGRMPHGGRRILLVDHGTGQRLELNWYPSDSPYAVPYTSGEGLDHLGYSTGRAEEIARRLERYGGRIALRPSDLLGVRQNYYVEDPDGNWVELMAWGTSRKTPRPPTPRTRKGPVRPSAQGPARGTT